MRARLEEMSGESLLSAYHAVRRHTVALAEPLSAEDCCVQSMPDASPVKWHLAHTTWFFETFILERMEPAFRPCHPAFRVLFNSYYNGVGDQHPRPQRGMLTRPSLGEVYAYRRQVDERIGMLLASEPLPAALPAVLEMGLHHEQQHQELLLTDVKHLLSLNPLMPAYCATPLESRACATGREWQSYEAGLVEIGHRGDGFGFCFDNEMPRHREFTEAFALAPGLVSNGDYLAFVLDGGYTKPALWLSEGWDWVCANGLKHPLYWRQETSGWQEFTLNGLHALEAERAATHLSFFEADAYARWCGARLPTEAEWERAAAEGEGVLSQLFGACWQWTLSSYAPYPGYRVAAGAIGEYNGKFMSNQYVLRGSSCATPPGHARVTYRNFFPASARWQFSGIRLARSL